jgi:hypothetical protein
MAESEIANRGSNRPANQKHNEWLHHLFFLFLGVALLVLYVILPRPPETVKAGLLAAALVFLLTAIERLWHWKSIKKQLKETASDAIKPLLDDAQNEISHLVEGMNETHAKLLQDLNAEHAERVKGLASDVNELVRAAEGCNLNGIHVDRFDSANRDGESKGLHAELTKKVEEANERVWLLGIAFTEGIELRELASILVRKKEREFVTLSKNPESKKLDVRILLLDPLRSTSVFRTLLESPLRDFATIVGADTVRGPDLNFLLKNTTLYRHSHDAYAAIVSDPNKILESSVKFYAHNPMCWLVIVDDFAFYEPYTFGKPENLREGDTSLGPYMPVFRFGRGRVLEILVSHFDRIWLTSDVGVVHYGARRDDEHVLGERIFQQRLAWLRRCYDALIWRERNGHAQDRRYPRYACDSETPPCLKVTWRDKNGGLLNDDLTATVLNSSRVGIGLKIADFHRHGKAEAGERFTIELARNAAQIAGTQKKLLDEFIGRELEVVWCKEVASAFKAWGVGLRREQRAYKRSSLGAGVEFEVTMWDNKELLDKELVRVSGEVNDYSEEGIRVTLRGLNSNPCPEREQHFGLRPKGSGNGNTVPFTLGAFWEADLEVRWAVENAGEPRTWTVGLKRRIQ